MILEPPNQYLLFKWAPTPSSARFYESRISSLSPTYFLSILQDSPAKANCDLPEKLLKKRRLLHLERFLSNSEPVIMRARGLNGEIPFLPERDIEDDMIHKSSAHAKMNTNALGSCSSCEIGKIIDRVSRFLFPFAFFVFNFFYWYYYLSK